jgi:hypothetical protein
VNVAVAHHANHVRLGLAVLIDPEHAADHRAPNASRIMERVFHNAVQG